MTPPLTRPIPPAFWWILLGCLILAIVMPFGRRDDWLGWLAFIVIVLAAIGIWGLLIFGVVKSFREQRQNENSSDR